MATVTLSIDSVSYSLNPDVIGDIVLGVDVVQSVTVKVDQVAETIGAPVTIKIDQVSFGFSSSSPSSSISSSPSTSASSSLSSSASSSASASAPPIVGNNNTYHQCDTSIDDEDTLSLYVDDFEVERTTAYEKRVGSPDTDYTSTDSLTGEVSFVGLARLKWTKLTATSVTITVGGTDASSVVANLQSDNDGNVFHLDELGAAPAIDFYVEFTSVTAFNWVKILAQYDGSNAHDMTIQLYNWTSAAWDTYSGLPSMNYDTTPNRTFNNGDFFVPSDTNYIGTGANDGKVRIRFAHFTMGNAAHDIYVDTVALYQ